MSIFLGDSIYNYGGGGGYKDGGELIDGDFIKITNNTVSNYSNDNRNDLNFYFDETQGSIINAVVELTNNNNATVNVYTVINGELYPLSYSGSNTVISGEQYSITVIGKSFIIENVNNVSNEPAAAIIDDIIYPIKLVGSRYYATKDFNSPIGKTSYVSEIDDPLPDGTVSVCAPGGTFYDVGRLVTLFDPQKFDGWNILLHNDPLFTTYKNSELRAGGSSGFNATPNGVLVQSFYRGAWRYGRMNNSNDCFYAVQTPAEWVQIFASTPNSYPSFGSQNKQFVKARLFKDK